MKSSLLAVAVFLAVALIEVALGDRIMIMGTKPSLTLIAVYAFSITEGEGKGILYGAVGGIIDDCLSGGYMGLFMSGYAIVGYLAGRAGMKWFNVGESANFAGIFLLSLINAFYTAALLNALRGGTDLLGTALRYGLPQAVYNAAAGAVLLWFFKGYIARRAPWLKAIREFQVRL